MSSSHAKPPVPTCTRMYIKAFYALATIPLINRLSIVQEVKQVWYTDDASAAGHLTSLRRWWDSLQYIDYGYHSNAKKTWLITKEQYLPQAQEIFQDTDVKTTMQGRPYLGAALGSEEYCAQIVYDKVMEWNKELKLLAEIAMSQPHATFAAFTHGFVHKFTYLARTTPFKDHLIQPLEDTIRFQLLPVWTGKAPPNDNERTVFTLPARLGSLGIPNLVNCYSKRPNQSQPH